MQTQKIGPNDPCWCGSGKKYKKCHRSADSPLPFSAIVNAVHQRWDEKLCLHPLASSTACDKIVSAHTVQRSGVLQQLTDDTNHVQTFYGTPRDKPIKVGWRNASTFTGFCSRHDDSTFKAIEHRPFTESPEQCFLVGYRALCHEIYQKRGFIRTLPLMHNLGSTDSFRRTQQLVQNVANISGAGARKGLAHFEELKASMDHQLLAGDFAGWSRLVVRFRGKLCIASTGAVSPNRDMDGRALQTLHDPDFSRQETLLYGVVSVDAGGAVVMVWPKNHVAPQRLLSSMLERGIEALPGLLTQFMFAYVENTFFSNEWWQSLTHTDRQHLTELARISNAYYTDFEYSNRSFVPWEIMTATIEEAV